MSRIHRSAPIRRRSALRVLLAAVPSLLVIVGGALSTALQSIGLLPLVGQARASTDAWTSISEDLFRAVLVSLGIAASSTALAVLVGSTAAFLIVSARRRSARIVEALGAATITVPHLIGAGAIGLLLADSGVLARLIPGVEWPPFVAGPWWGAVILEYAWKESAFIALVVVAALSTRVARYDETAAVLGARWSTRLRMVHIPLATPALVISATIAFVYALGSFEVAWLLGRTYPEPLAVLAMRLYTDVSVTARPEAAAVATSIVLISALVAVAAFGLLRRSAVWR